MNEQPNIIALADLHIGSQTGLCPPEVGLSEGGKYMPNEAQRTMYYMSWEPLVKKATSGKSKKGLVLDGDLLDLDVKQRGDPLISTNPNDIQTAAIELLAPLIDRAKWVLMTRGTGAHVGSNGCHEETLAKLIDKAWPNKIIPHSQTSLVSPHITAEIDGKRWDISHHTEVGPGRAQTTQATYAIRLAVAVYNRYIAAGEKPPDYVIRGHHHFPAEAEYRGIRVICLPGWQWPTEYVYRIGGAEIQAVFGGLIGPEMETYKIRRKGLWQKI